jgi:hypothetical protein
VVTGKERSQIGPAGAKVSPKSRDLLVVAWRLWGVVGLLVVVGFTNHALVAFAGLDRTADFHDAFYALAAYTAGRATYLMGRVAGRAECEGP